MMSEVLWEKITQTSECPYRSPALTTHVKYVGKNNASLREGSLPLSRDRPGISTFLVNILKQELLMHTPILHSELSIV